MSTNRSSEQVREAILGISADVRRTHANAVELRDIVAKRNAVLTHDLTTHGGSNGKVEEASVGFVINSTFIDELNRVKTALSIVEASPNHAEAVERLVPLLAELEEAEAREQAEAEALSKARNAVAEAEEAARVKLLSKIDSDPAVKAAKEKLEQLAPDTAARELAQDLH